MHTMKTPPTLSRRDFIGASTLAVCGLPLIGSASQKRLVEMIDHAVVKTPALPKGTWFHPRACVVGDSILMTTQPIIGSDTFGHVHYTTTHDMGQTWSALTPVPALGWMPMPDGNNEAVCDVTPEFHPKTRSVLALGHNVFYKGKAFYRDQPARWPVYAVWKNGSWGTRRKLVWDDPRGSYIYSNNCGQRIVLPNGDVLMSFTFGVKDQPRSVCGVLCSFDGEELVIQRTGDAINHSAGRGLLEPSLTHYGGRFYLTMRAEDRRAYVAVSDDGLSYEPKQEWTWDDGEPLVTNSTQQHWITHSEGLFLVYTRRDPSNEKVIRWRAPLWIAQVDTKTMRLVRATERIVLPLVGDGVNAADMVPMMGNFGVLNASPGESWVTDGSWCPKTNTGELHLARVKWASPNTLYSGA